MTISGTMEVLEAVETLQAGMAREPQEAVEEMVELVDLAAPRLARVGQEELVVVAAGGSTVLAEVAGMEAAEGVAETGPGAHLIITQVAAVGEGAIWIPSR